MQMGDKLRSEGRNYKFKRPHGLLKNFHQYKNDVNFMSWPSKSADLNPTKH